MIPLVEFLFQLVGVLYVTLEFALICSQKKFYILFSWDLFWIYPWFVCRLFASWIEFWLAQNIHFPILYVEVWWWPGRWDLGLERERERPTHFVPWVLQASLTGLKRNHRMAICLVSKAWDISQIFPSLCREDISYSPLLFSTAWRRAAVTLQPLESLLIAGQGSGLLSGDQLCGGSPAFAHEWRASLRNAEIPHVWPGLPQAVQTRHDVATGEAADAHEGCVKLLREILVQSSFKLQWIQRNLGLLSWNLGKCRAHFSPWNLQFC